MPNETASNPSVSNSGSVYAAVDANLPEWRKIIRISGTAEGGFTSEVVKDYVTVKAVESALAELADSDDPPAQQALLMNAWQSLAMYLAVCDDEDKPGAMQALSAVSNLMSDSDDDTVPMTGGGGGGYGGGGMQTAATSYSCPKCERGFSTEQGLINHLKNLHAAREKQTKATPANDQD